MITHCSTHVDPRSFPTQELEQVEAAIRSSTTYLAALVERHEYLLAELDLITRPAEIRLPVRSHAVGPGYEYRGTFVQRWTAIDIYQDLLRRLWTDFPEQRQRMVDAIAANGRTRTYVAESAAKLFPQRAITWALQYSRKLVDGWYFDTNLNRKTMDALLAAATTAAGLSWGTDVKVYWNSVNARSISR